LAARPGTTLATCSGVTDYVAHGLGPIEGVQAVQTAPVIRTVKRAGTLMEPP
jgi:hypothetical protein